MSQVGSLQTAHSRANGGVELGAHVRRREAFETINYQDGVSERNHHSSSSLGSRCVPWLGECLSMLSPNYPVLCSCPLPYRCGDLMSKCYVVICIHLCLCAYEIPRLLSLLVLACIASKDERDIPSKFGVSTPALLYKV